MVARTTRPTPSTAALIDTGEPATWQRARARLLEERARLRRLHSVLRAAATSRCDFEPHDVSDDEAAIQADLVEQHLIALDGALSRLDTGAYGRCAACASPIRAGTTRGAAGDRSLFDVCEPSALTPMRGEERPWNDSRRS